MTTSALKRRSFLQGSLLAAAVIGSTPAVAAEAAKPKFDESFDVIVVGSGIAGTMAALSAADKGANVLWFITSVSFKPSVLALEVTGLLLIYSSTKDR